MRRDRGRLTGTGEMLGIVLLWCLGVLVLSTCVGLAWWIG